MWTRIARRIKLRAIVCITDPVFHQHYLAIEAGINYIEYHLLYIK